MELVEIKPYFYLTDYYVDFYTKGMFAFDGSDILSDVLLRPLVELDKRFPDGSLSSDTGCANYERNSTDDIVIAALRERLIQIGLPLVPETLKFHFLEYRTNPDVFKWHNDNGSHFADHNVTINCFFDNTSEESGGRFDVLSFNPHVDTGIAGSSNDQEQMASLYPKKFTIVVFNQNPEYLHKVTPAKNLRRMISYAGSLK